MKKILSLAVVTTSLASSLMADNTLYITAEVKPFAVVKLGSDINKEEFTGKNRFIDSKISLGSQTPSGFSAHTTSVYAMSNSADADITMTLKGESVLRMEKDKKSTIPMTYEYQALEGKLEKFNPDEGSKIHLSGGLKAVGKSVEVGKFKITPDVSPFTVAGNYNTKLEVIITAG